jgi:hypothetical protein
MHEMIQTFSTYRELKGSIASYDSSGSSYGTVRGYVETLETYNLMSRQGGGGRGTNNRQVMNDKVCLLRLTVLSSIRLFGVLVCVLVCVLVYLGM